MHTDINRVSIPTAVTSSWMRMSKTLRETILRQTVAGVRRYGHSVKVTVPAGPMAQEMRRMSAELILAGAIIRTGENGTTMRGAQIGGEFTFVAHHIMVDTLLQGITEGRRFTTTETRSRFSRVSKLLHDTLTRGIPEGIKGEILVTIDNAISTVDVGVKAYSVTPEGKTPMTYTLDKLALNLIRSIIAPRNQQAAEVTIVFNTMDKRSLYMRTNRFCVSEKVSLPHVLSRDTDLSGMALH